MVVGIQKDGSLGIFRLPCWGVSWGHVAIKIHFQVDSNLDPISEGILEHLGIDFGWFGGAKMESKTEPKIRSIKSRKIHFWLGGSLVFEVPRGSKINEKTIKNRLQDKTST